MAEYIPRDCRLFYVISGQSEIWCENTTYTMKKGSLLIIPSGKKYRLCTPCNEVTYLAFNFDYTFANHKKVAPIPPCIVQEFTENKLLEKVNFQATPCLNQPFFCNDCEYLERKLIKIEVEYTGRLLYSEHKSSAYLLSVLTSCVQSQLLSVNRLDGAHQKVNQIITYIKQNFRESLTNRILAEKFHFHPNYISSLIKQYTGMPLHRYLLHVRIQNAINLLETTNESIEEIAATTGFYDSSYFTKYFKSVTGKKPSQFRS